jgi:hypothetical protein
MPLMGTLLLIIRIHTSRGFRVHTLICRGSGLPLQFLVSPANVHDAPFARPLLEISVRLYRIRPRVIRLDAAYWGLRLIHWIHTCNPGRRRSDSAAASNASLAASFSFFVSNVLLSPDGQLLFPKSP